MYQLCYCSKSAHCQQGNDIGNSMVALGHVVMQPRDITCSDYVIYEDEYAMNFAF